MKSKMLTRIIGAVAAFSMAAGVGVAIGGTVAKEVVPVRAETGSVTRDASSALSTTATQIGSAPVTIKTSSSNDYTNPCRLYANTTITIAATGGATLTYVTYEAYSTGNYVSYAQNATVNPNVKPSVSSKNVTWTFTTSPTQFTIKPSSQTRWNNITVGYDTGSGTKYSVTYANGGATSGTVPTDSNEYDSGDTVTVLGQGTLAKTNYDFAGWSDGTTTYDEDDTFTITSDVTLTAQWTYSKHYTDDTSAKTITWDLTNPEYMSAGTDQMSWSSPKATMVVDRASAGTATNNYCPPSHSSTRFYAKSVLTIAPMSGYQINSVVFTATTDNYATALKNSAWTNASASLSSTVVTITPTDNKSSFMATIGDTTGISTVVVHYDIVVTDPVLTLSTYSVTMFITDEEGVSVTATVQNVASPTYVWSSNDANITLENTTSATVKIYPDTSVAGSATVHLIVGGTTPNLTADVAVTINVPGAGETIATAYTVAQARNAIDAGEGVTGVYATGIVSEIVTEYNSQYKNISFNFSADGTTSSNQLEAYRCGGNDAEFVSVGDTVVVYGNLVLYNSTTYEFTSGCEIVSRTSPWVFNRLELVASEDYDNTYYQNGAFSSDGLTVNYVEVNSNTNTERNTDVTSGATFNYDLTTTGTNKNLTATYGGYTSNAIKYNVIEMPEYDIIFGTNNVKIDAESVTDSNSGWTITTEFSGDTSFTPNASYCQVGSAKKPATSITFRKTIDSVVTLKRFFIKVGGFSGTEGTVTLKVDSVSVGTGSLDDTNDVMVSASSYGRGGSQVDGKTNLEITITGISKGVKVYGIAYLAKTDTEMVQEFVDDYMHMSHTTNDGSCKNDDWYDAAKREYGRLLDPQKYLFATDSTFTDARTRLVAWAQANNETFNPVSYSFAQNSRAIFNLGESSEDKTMIGVIGALTIATIAAFSVITIKKRKSI